MPWSDETGCHDLSFCWVLSQLFHSSLLSPSSRSSIVSLCFLPLECYHLHIWGCWYLTLAILIPACDSSSPQCLSIVEWIKELWSVYPPISICMYNGILFIKRILPFVTSWMDLEIMLSEINQIEKDKYFVFTYTWNLKNKTNKQIKQKQSYRYREWTSGCLTERGSGWRKELGEADLRNTNFQLQKKWVRSMKCKVWGI